MTKLRDDRTFYSIFIATIAVLAVFLISRLACSLDAADSVSRWSIPPSGQCSAAVPDCEKIIEYSQHPNYPTGCESVSLYILLKYYGVEVTVDEIIESLPKGPKPRVQENRVVYGGNPEAEFVGDPRESGSYGVYEQPIAQTANGFLEGAVGEKNVKTTELEELIKSRPVIAWISLSPNRRTDSERWYAFGTDEEVEWISGEHAVVVYGICDEGYMISDPNEGKKRVIPQSDFEVGFLRHGGRVVYYQHEV